MRSLVAALLLALFAALASAQRVVPACTYATESIALTVYSGNLGPIYVQLDEGSWSVLDGINYAGTFFFTVIQPSGEEIQWRQYQDASKVELEVKPPPPPPTPLQRLASFFSVSKAAPQKPRIRLDLVGALGCSGQKLLLVSIDSCQQTLYGVPDLCAWAKSYFGGAYQYSVQVSPSGEISIIIPKWFNADSPFTVYSTVNTCDPFYNCSISPEVNLYTTLYGGAANISNSQVQILPDPNGNTTIINVDGDTTTFENSVNITLVAPNVTNINTTLYNSTINISAEPDTVELNIYAYNTSACPYSAEWRPISTEANQTLDGTADALIMGSGGELVAAGDWQLPTENTLRYVGSVSPARFSLEWCIVEAKVYAPSSTQDQHVRLHLWNVTTVSDFEIEPLAVAISAVNPANVTLTSACASILAEVKTGDTFRLYASAEGGAGFSSLLLAPSATFSLMALSDGCASGAPASNTTVNVTFNVNVTVNGTALEPRKCLAIYTEDDDGTFVIENTGICDVLPDSEYYPETCNYFSVDSNGTATHHFSGVCAVDANGGTPRGGRISLVNSTTVGFTNSPGAQQFSAHSLLSFAAGSCLSVSTSGVVTNYTNTGLCGMAANSGPYRSGSIRLIDSTTIGVVNAGQDFYLESKLEFAAGTCLAVVQDGARINYTNTGVCGVSVDGDTARTGTLDWQDSPTIDFVNSGNNFTAHSRLAFTGLKCLSVSQSGASVNLTNTGLCSIGSANSVLTANTDGNGVVTVNYTGITHFRAGNPSSATFRGGQVTLADSIDGKIVYTETSPGIFRTVFLGEGGEGCFSCNTTSKQVDLPPEYTLNVERLCAEQQCEVRSDPPTDTPSPGGQWRPNYCIFGCGDGDGDNDDGSDGDGDDGGGFAVIPPILPPPLFPPLFPPILPVGPPGGGSTGSSSSPNGPPGGDPNSPGAVYPITTYLPPGADPPTVQGGTWVPIVNFSQAVPYCGADSSPSRLGSLVLDISVQPSQVYLCQVVANGSYAWMPYCPCQLGASNNRTYYYYNVTTLWRDNSTVLISNTSQLINTGATYLGGPVFIAGPIVFSDSVDMCNASQVQLPRINGCGGEAPEFPDGLNTSLILAPGTLIIAASSVATPIVTTTEVRTASVINSDMLGSRVPFPDGLEVCDSGKLARIRELGGCAGFPVLMSDGFNTTAPSTTNGPLSINGPLTITNPSTFSISGFPSPLFASSTVTTLYYVPTILAGTICVNFTPMLASFSLNLVRIASSKFVYWDFSNFSIFPPALTFASSNGCVTVTLSTSPNTLVRYSLPSEYRPSSLYSTTVTSGTSGTMRSTPFAFYTSVAGVFEIISDNGGSADFPTGAIAFYMPTLSYV